MHGLIPRPFIDELLTRIDIVELIDAYVPLKKRGLNHLACCPFHQEKTPSFNVIPKKQFFHCFGCGSSGNAISFIMNYLHQSFPQAIETLAAKAGLQVPREDMPDKIKKSVPLQQVLQKICDYYQQTLRTTGITAIKYLKQRGVNGDTAKRYQIGYAEKGWHVLEEAFQQNRAELLSTGMLVQKEDGKTYDRYRQRIMFPIHDRHGRVIGFGGRAIENEQQPKYLNSPETILFQKGRELYGLYHIIEQQPQVASIIIVEGYLDVLALSQHGVTNAVATLGTATSAYHIQLLSKYTQQLIFCFDGDKAGRNAAWRALEASLPYLDTGLSASFVFLPEGHDPDSFIREQGKEAFDAQLKTAIPLNQLLFDTLASNITITDLAGKNRLILAAKPYLLKIAPGAYKTLLINDLARLTRIEPHRMEQLLTDDAIEETKPSLAPASVVRTPTRIALALLIQNPNMNIPDVTSIEPSPRADTDHALLIHLLQHLKTHPKIHTASLIEDYRESQWFDLIMQLASWEHKIPDQAIAIEFSDTLKFINKKTQEFIIQQLIDKSKQQTLSETERQTLQQMLHARHVVD